MNNDEKLICFLKDRLPNTQTAEDAVERFSELCAYPLDTEEDRLLFETGVYDFDGVTGGKPMFFFSLVRQFDGTEGEFKQLQLILLYEPTPVLEGMGACKWGETRKAKKFMKKVRSDKAFAYLKDVPCEKYKIYCEET